MRTENFCKKLRLKNLPDVGWGFVWHSTKPQAGLYTAIIDQQPVGTFRFALGHDSWRIAINNKQQKGELYISIEDEMYLDEFSLEIAKMTGPQMIGS